MKVFDDFNTYNAYVGLSESLNNDIDVGRYNPQQMLMKSEPVKVDFYRVSIKINFIDNLKHDGKPVTAVFFNSPDWATGWDAEPSYKGMYLQLSKRIINQHRFLFKNYLDYGQHEALYPTESEIAEITTVFELMFKCYQIQKRPTNILLSYVNVLISLIEVFYQRQFSANHKQYNSILTNFQQELNNYYDQPVKQLPTVQYFADKLGLTSNYLGDIVKHQTKKSAIENIHEFVIKKATDLLQNNKSMNSAEIAYSLGFEYPNYFARFFKRHVNLTPKQYRLAAANSNRPV